MDQQVDVRRKPRYLLGTFWLVIGVAVFFGGIAQGKPAGIIVGPLLIAYSVYLYRGGRFGFIIW
jgi:hypothetical protein